MTLIRRALIGALLGLIIAALLWVGALTNEALAAFPLDSIDVMMLTLGGTVGSLIHGIMVGAESRRPVRDYIAWAVAGSAGTAIQGLKELYSTGSPREIVAGAVFGLLGGLAVRVWVRYLSDRSNQS